MKGKDSGTCRIVYRDTALCPDVNLEGFRFLGIRETPFVKSFFRERGLRKLRRHVQKVGDTDASNADLAVVTSTYDYSDTICMRYDLMHVFLLYRYVGEDSTLTPNLR